MTQFDFDLICKLIQAGAPILANDLIKSLSDVINAANAAITERDALKKELETLTSEAGEPERPSPKKA